MSGVLNDITADGQDIIAVGLSVAVDMIVKMWLAGPAASLMSPKSKVALPVAVIDALFSWAEMVPAAIRRMAVNTNKIRFISIYD